MVEEDTAGLRGADEEEAEVNGGETVRRKLASGTRDGPNPLGPKFHVCGVGGNGSDIQHICRSNDETPARPDRVGSHKSQVLCKRELLSRS